MSSYYEHLSAEQRRYLPAHLLLASFIDEDLSPDAASLADKQSEDQLLSRAYRTKGLFVSGCPKHISRCIQHIEKCIDHESR